jgi:hypothetical protein
MMPSNWTQDYCLSANTFWCAMDGPQAVRMILSYGGPSVESPTIWLNGTRVLTNAISNNASSKGAGIQDSNSADTVLLLPQGCHHTEVVFQDNPVQDEGAQVWSISFALPGYSQLEQYVLRRCCLSILAQEHMFAV